MDMPVCNEVLHKLNPSLDEACVMMGLFDIILESATVTCSTTNHALALTPTLSMYAT